MRRRLLSSSAVGSRLATQILNSQRTDISTHHLEALLRIMRQPEDIAAVEQKVAGSPNLLRPLVGAYSAAGRRDEALRLLRQGRPPADAFDPLLVASVESGDDRDLRAAYWLMREAGVAPSGDTYGELIKARVKRGEAERAFRVCTHALESGQPPPPGAVEDLHEALVEAGMMGSALELAELLRVRHGWSASERATQLLLDGAARSDLPLEVLSVLQELRLHRTPEEAPRLAADLLHRCCRAGNVAAARALLRECDAEGLQLEAESRDELLQALLKEEGGLNEALQFYDASTANLMSLLPASSRPSPSTASTVNLVLDLRGIPEGARRLSCVRYFQRLANATPTESLLAGHVLQDRPAAPASSSGLRLMLSEPSHAAAVIQQAAELQPPIALRLADAPPTSATDAPSVTVLTADPDELSQWARRCAEERLRAKRTGGLALAIAGHNAAWVAAAVAWGALPL